MSTFARALARMGATDQTASHGCADPDRLPPAPRFTTQVDEAEVAAWTERNKATREAYYLRPFADQRLH